MKAMVPCFCVSVALHVGGFAALATLMPSQTGLLGSLDGEADRVFVCVVSEQDVTPFETTLCPVDSPAARESEKAKEQSMPLESPELLTREIPYAPPEPKELASHEEPDRPPELVTHEKHPRNVQEDSSKSSPQAASDPYMRRAALGKDVRNFQSLLLAAIRQATFFPREAVKQRRHGEVVVSFTINRDGSLARIAVVGSSGSATLDDAALDIIRKASEKFPKFPASVSLGSLDYTVPILFKEKRSDEAASKRSAR